MKLVSDAVWNAIQAELEAKREDVRRLTEALARKNDVPLYLPVQSTPEQRQFAVESSSGWFDTKPIPVIPPKIGDKRQ